MSGLSCTAFRVCVGRRWHGATGMGLTVEERIVVEFGVLKGHAVPVRDAGDPCGVCEGPCRFDSCRRCGGHSEHNAGCPETGWVE